MAGDGGSGEVEAELETFNGETLTRGRMDEGTWSQQQRSAVADERRRCGGGASPSSGRRA